MDYSTLWSQSTATLATLRAEDDDDQVTLTDTGRPRLRGDCILKMTPNNIKNTTFVSEHGRTEFTVKTVAENPNGTMWAGVSKTSVFDYRGRLIGMFTKPLNLGTDMIILGDQAPIKKKSWLSSGGPFSNVIGKFEHDGNIYKWLKVKQEDKTLVVELHIDDNTAINPLARFTGSRKDPDAPNDRFVVLEPQLEILTLFSSPIMLDLLMFSFVLVEKLRRDSEPRVLSVQEGTIRANRS